MRRRLTAAVLLSAVCARRLQHDDRGDSVFEHEAEAFADVESALSTVPRCRPRRYMTKEQSWREQLAVEAKGQRCSGRPSAVLGLGTIGPAPSESLAALGRAVSANGVPCQLLSHGGARRALQNTTLIMLGDSTVVEDWHYLTWMLYPESVQGQIERAVPWFNTAPRMPEGRPPLLGRQLPDDPDGPGLNISACWTIDDPNGPEVRRAFCPGHRRAETVLQGPGGRTETALAMRFTGHHEVSSRFEGIDAYFHPDIRKEWTMLMQRAINRGHKVVIIASTGQHDPPATLIAAYRTGLKNNSADPMDGVPTLELGLARFRVQVERLMDRLARFQIAGAHVIWRGCNHAPGEPGAVPGTQHPASEYSMLRRIDRITREVFDKQLRPFGAHYLNVSEITRVYMGDGGWHPRVGFFMDRDRRPWQLPFEDGVHIGARQRWRAQKRLRILNSTLSIMEINGLVAQALLNLAAHGCPGVRRAAG